MKITDGVQVLGAREHNLKNIDVFIPRNKITVITGLSGSGKSSLAFDTIYAEGQRRYMDGLSAYAKQFLDQFKKPEVDSITGLSPSISIEQKTSSTNVRSTVGTVTETYDLFRILFSKVGTAKCPKHGEELKPQSAEKIIEQVMGLPTKTKIIIYSPAVRSKKGEFQKELKSWFKEGFLKAIIDGDAVEIDQMEKLQKTKLHDIDLVVDRLVIREDVRHRVSQAVEKALKFGSGQLIIEDYTTKERTLFSQNANCPKCNFSFPDYSDPKFFSFNSPRGWCKTCKGIGTVDIDEWGDSYKVVYDSNLEDGGSDYDELSIEECKKCEGKRLAIEARNVFFHSVSISDLSGLYISELHEYLSKVQLTKIENKIVGKLFEEIKRRLDYLDRMGVGYLKMDRPSRSLSGGETQRIRLASQVGNGLVGVLYVLDEPSIGLHPQDHSKVLELLRELRDRGNTIIIVEHDEESIQHADYIYDLGPRAGVLGGNIQAKGKLSEIKKDKNSITGKYLSGKATAIVHRKEPVNNDSDTIQLKGAEQNNLKKINLEFPLKRFVTVTGVSGSGKSTLVIDTLYKAIAKHINNSEWTVGKHKNLQGIESIDRVININQKPIGRTPRSNPATYTGLFSPVRELFANLPESKVRGFKPGHFSFNVKGGRCEECNGAGRKKVEMNFMANVYVDCDVCLGLRYNRETLGIKYNDKNIAEVLSMTVSEAHAFFTSHKKIHMILSTLMEVGLDYLTLGQYATTLSGGEAQRIKLSKELSKRSSRHNMYILDEPTTGLHFEDIRKLNELLHKLVSDNNSLIVIEHNLDVIKSSEYIIELGPKGGKDGGQLLYQGDIKGLKKVKNSPTAPFL
ncbi:MAG: excinuclease ABC subunit UvrA [Bdellovibrionales bacterium]